MKINVIRLMERLDVPVGLAMTTAGLLAFAATAARPSATVVAAGGD